MSVLEVNDVSIRYLTGDFKDIGLKEYVMRKLKGNYHVTEFWADHHITFSLEKGDMLGIIGTNGAGKSTLLKAVSGIMEPTGGYVKRQGNIAALLELSSGFDGDLTVRENAYLRGAMLGYTRQFMDEKYPEIIAFSELEEFQDRPFKQLSSGMMSRLAFSVASLVQPDILILDEVLSVGDGAFRKKSEAKMREIISGGATTILVSHLVEQVREMCNKVLWIEKGNQIGFGEAGLLCDLYQSYLDGAITLDEAKARLAEAGVCRTAVPDEALVPPSQPPLPGRWQQVVQTITSTKPEAGWCWAWRGFFWGWTLALLLLAGMMLSLCSLFLAIGHYPPAIFYGYLSHPLLLLLNTLPILLLELLLYALLRRADLSFLITSAVVMGLSLGNYFKLVFRDDPLMLADLLLLREAGNMLERYRPFLNKRLAAIAVCLVVCLLALHFLARARVKWRSKKFLVLLLAPLAAGALLTGPLLNIPYYEYVTFYPENLPNEWSHTQQYIAHGFVYPFLHSANDAFETPPENYDAEKAAAVLAAYPSEDIPEDRKVNLVAVMLEAYSDFSSIGQLDFLKDPYAYWHELAGESYSGELTTNIFAGSTVNTERCFLTGDLNAYNYRTDTNSYVWYLRSQGYRAEGMHPCYQWFYNRQNINPYLGFEDYFFTENYFADLGEPNAAYDPAFFPELLKTCRAGFREETPYFNFSLTYQGHGPYPTGYYSNGDGHSYIADDGTYSNETQHIAENYFARLADTSQQLRSFVDGLREEEEPVVLVLFGDHKPWMGNSNEAYEELGIDLDTSAMAGFTNYYNTPYLIWANDAAREVLGDVFQGKGPTISPCFLMNEVFRLCGWKGPSYLQFAGEVEQQVQVIHTSGRYVVDGQLVEALDAEKQEAVDTLRSLEYYRRRHFDSQGL